MPLSAESEFLPALFLQQVLQVLLLPEFQFSVQAQLLVQEVGFPLLPGLRARSWRHWQRPVRQEPKTLPSSALPECWTKLSELPCTAFSAEA